MTMKRREFLRKTAVTVVGTAILPAVLPNIELDPYVPPLERHYVHMAIDNHIVANQGAGAFDDLSDRIFDKLWSAWADMELRCGVSA